MQSIAMLAPVPTTGMVEARPEPRSNKALLQSPEIPSTIANIPPKTAPTTGIFFNPDFAMNLGNNFLRIGLIIF